MWLLGICMLLRLSVNMWMSCEVFCVSTRASKMAYSLALNMF